MLIGVLESDNSVGMPSSTHRLTYINIDNVTKIREISKNYLQFVFCNGTTVVALDDEETKLSEKLGILHD